MSKRNFILLITVLGILIISILGYFYFMSRSGNPIDSSIPGINFLAEFNPFGTRPTTTGDETPGDETYQDEIPTDEELAAVKLRKVSSMPISGFAVFNKERLKEVPIPEVIPNVNTDGSTVSANGEANTTLKTTTTKKTIKPVPPPTEFAPALRYVARATGNIYQTFVDKIEERMFSGTVIPKIYDAYLGNLGQSVVMRHLKPNEVTIETFSGALPKEKLGEDLPSNELVGSFLNNNIQDISLSPDTSKIFYMYTVGESIVGAIMNLSDKKITQIFNSAFTEWNSFWPNSKTITLTTRPSGNILGYMYSIDIASKNFTNVLGSINGLTTLMSPDGKLILVGNSALSLYTYDTSAKTYSQLGVKTLPEKCVWSKLSDVIYCAVPGFVDNALYPDDWYKGEISFSDQIWRINIKTGVTNLIADPIFVLGGEDIDGTKLMLDDKETYLFFVNKKDSFLWELELN